MRRPPADAPGVKEGVVVDAKNGGTFHKEGAAFLKILFISGEIESRRVCLYLPEIGIDGSVEGDAGGDAILDISADVSPQSCLAIQRCPPHSVRNYFHMARGMDILDTPQLPHPREPVGF